MSIGFSKNYEVAFLSATSSQPAIKFVTSRHLGTKWCGWFSTRPKALFEPLISSGHFGAVDKHSNFHAKFTTLWYNKKNG